MKRSLPLTLASLTVASAQQNLRGLQGASWYVYTYDSTSSQNNKCVNTCTDPGVPYCMGGQGQYATVEECCTKALYWECTDGPPPCDACTDAPFTPVPVDTTKWYVRDSDSKCVRNCDTADGTDCGGVEWKSWIVMFASMEECCDQAIPWKCPNTDAPHVCEACTIGDAVSLCSCVVIIFSAYFSFQNVWLTPPPLIYYVQFFCITVCLHSTSPRCHS